MSKFTTLLFLLISYISFSQTEQLISGKVSYQETFQKNIDVINFTSKKITQTNALGAFSIEAKVNDVLIFMSDNFIDQKYKLTAEDFEKKVLSITLIEKPIPLEEIEIQQVKQLKIAAVSYNDMKMTKIQKDAARPKVEGVYTGEMVNAVDFIQLGKMVGKLFKSNKPKAKKAAETVSFKEYATTNFNPTFFYKTLKLKPEETSRFLEYCQSDPKSTTTVESSYELTVLEFLLAKKAEFDKLK
jgi:hypothetical protein